MSLRRPLLAFSLLVVSCAVLAAPMPPAVAGPAVTAVQSPAWLEREGQRRPLVPGEVLGNRDQVLTGNGARVLIQLPEGSAVKLGENAQLKLNALGTRPGGVYTAALDVLQGAFRFTTGLFQKRFEHRAVNIRATTLTAGIRGTDLWGKSDGEKDLICLLEGHVVVTHPQGEAMELAEPLAFASALRDQAPQPVTRADAAEVEKWSMETELQPGQGVLRRDGMWGINFPAVASQAEALHLYDRLRVAGYPARVRVTADSQGEEGYAYRLRVGGWASRTEAAAVAARLGALLEMAPGSVSR